MAKRKYIIFDRDKLTRSPLTGYWQYPSGAALGVIIAQSPVKAKLLAEAANLDGEIIVYLTRIHPDAHPSG